MDPLVFTEDYLSDQESAMKNRITSSSTKRCCRRHPGRWEPPSTDAPMRSAHWNGYKDRTLKTRYLGKNINGVPVKVRTEGIPGPCIASVPTAAYTHGNLLPLQDIIKELRIDEHLAGLAHEREVGTILVLACNRIVRPLALHQVATWYEESSLILTHPDLPFSSQSLSELLARLGTRGVLGKFMELLVRNLSTDSTLIYDITSLSSYFQLISLLEYGYNRDGLELPQINFSLILDAAQAIPVMYDLYPGSIVDVVTLKNTLHRVRSLGIREYTLVLDRSFFSQGNLEELVEEQLSFVIPASLPSRR